MHTLNFSLCSFILFNSLLFGCSSSDRQFFGLSPDASSDSQWNLGNCRSGDSCGQNGICNTQGQCCESALSACKNVCCENEQICYQDRCVTLGKVCRSDADCTTEEQCNHWLEPANSVHLDGGIQTNLPSVSCPTNPGRCMPKPIPCSGETQPNDSDPKHCVQACEYHPTPTPFELTEKWVWPQSEKDRLNTSLNVKTSMMIGPLVDDNCDGKYDEKDIPVLVFPIGYSSLQAVSGKDGTSLWTTTEQVSAYPVAIGEVISSSPGPEVIACSQSSNGIIVFSSKGEVLWKPSEVGLLCRDVGPQLGDVDGDGVPEILIYNAVLSAKTQQSLFKVSDIDSNQVGFSAFADLDKDGDLDIVAGNRVYRNDGKGAFSLLWNGNELNPPLLSGHIAIADLDQKPDQLPEIVLVHESTHTLRVVNGQNGSTLWGPVDLENSYIGLPTVADFDRDGKPDIGINAGYSYYVYDGAKGTLKWQKKTESSITHAGSTVFDLDGDGQMEVLYADTKFLYVFKGSNGDEISKKCNPTYCPNFLSPIVADVDGDQQADIVMPVDILGGAACRPSHTLGFRVFSSKSNNWAPARRIWNQHTYHVTNINDNATIPIKEQINWNVQGLNNFRQNVPPQNKPFNAPNAVAEVLSASCTSPATVRVVIRNVGSALLPTGMPIGLYVTGTQSGVSRRVGATYTKFTIAPGGYMLTDLIWDSPSVEFTSGHENIFVKLDDDPSKPHTWHECRTDDNTSNVLKAQCKTPVR